MKIYKKKKLTKVKNIGKFKEKVLYEFPCESKSLYMAGYTLFIISTNISGIIYKARHAHKHLYTVLPKYSKIQVLPGITSCRLMKDNKQAIELNSLLINNMPEDGYG